MKVGDRRVVAPDEIELRGLGKFGRASGDGAVSPRPCFAAYAAAQGAPIELSGAQAIEKTRGHAVSGQQTVRTGIGHRHHRLRTPAADGLAYPLVDIVQRRLPRDPLEFVRAFGPEAAQRMQQAPRSVHELGHLPSHLGGDYPGRVGHGLRTADLDDPAVGDTDAQAAGIGAIESADAGALLGDHRSSFRVISQPGSLACLCIKGYSLPTEKRAARSPIGRHWPQLPLLQIRYEFSRNTRFVLR